MVVCAAIRLWSALSVVFVIGLILGVGAFADPVMAGQAADGAQDEATEPLITDRPDFTESAVSVSPGGFQLETGYTFSGVEREKTHSFGEVLLRVGVAERLELRFGFNSYSRVRTGSGKLTGLEDTSFGLKLELVEGDPGTGVDRPDVAVLVSTSLPTGSDAFSADGLQPSVAVALAWDLTESLALGSNLGYSMLRDGGETFDELFGSVALGLGLSERFGTYVEIYGFFPTEVVYPDVAYFNTGVTYLIAGDVQLDARVGYGLNGLDDDFFFGLGAATRW